MVDPIPLHPLPSPDGASRPPAASTPLKPTILRRSGNVVTAAFERRGLRLNADERAFLPAALEIIETPVSPTLRLTAGLLCGLVTAAIAWSCLAHIDMVAVAPGKVVPLGQVKVVQPLETATIRAIRVDDGDHVVAGQALVDLDPTEAQADLTALGYDRGEALLDAAVARFLLESGAEPRLQPSEGLPRLRPTPTRLDRIEDAGDAALAARIEHQDDPAISASDTLASQAAFGASATPDGVTASRVQQAWAQAVEERGKHAAEMADLAAQIAEKRAALAGNAAQIARAKGVLPLLDDRYTTAKGLFDKGFAPKQPMLEADQQLLERQADLAVGEQTAGQIVAETHALEARLSETETAFRGTSLDRLAKAEAKRAQLEGEMVKARQRIANRHLVAPVDGTIEGVKIHTAGAVVTAADVLMSVVPDGTGIEIEAQVENKDIGFVREGQAVEVKVDAFPFTRYGLLHGTLRKVGRDAVQMAQAGGNHDQAGTPGQGTAAPEGVMTYPAKVSLDQSWIDVDGQREQLQPGMRVAAEIRTGDRRVIDYLLSPFVQKVTEAGRER